MMKKYKLGEVCLFNATTINRTSNLTISYLDTSNLIEGHIIKTSPICLLDAPSRAQRKVKHHTILYSLVRPNQRHYGILHFPEDNLVVSTGFVTIDIRAEYRCIVDPLYLYAQLTQNCITEYLQAIAENSVSAYPSILPADIANIEFEFPDIETQYRVSGFMKNLDRKIALNRAINHNLPIPDHS